MTQASMGGSLTCPKCGCPEYGGVEVQGVYDGVLFWECFACGWQFHRWPTGDDYYNRAYRIIGNGRFAIPPTFS